MLAFFDDTVNKTPAIFNKTPKARSVLVEFLRDCLEILVKKAKFDESLVEPAIDYMVDTTDSYGKAEKIVMLRSMLAVSMQKWGPLSHNLQAPVRPINPPRSLAYVTGRVTGIKGGFGKPKKRPRFEKGSEEAKAHMAELRAKRQKK